MTDDEGFSAPSRSDEAPHGDQQQPLEDVENEALDAGEGELAQADDPSSRKLLLTGSPEHVARLFYLFSSAGKAATQERGRVYQHAFQVADDDIRRIDRRVRELLKIPATLDGNIDFSGTVRFPDLSTQRFSDLDDLLERAGEQKDPETLLLYWRAILAEPFGH